MADSDFKLPSHCYSCGVYLMGGATQHKPGCAILKIIEDVCGLKLEPEGRADQTTATPEEPGD